MLHAVQPEPVPQPAGSDRVQDALRHQRHPCRAQRRHLWAARAHHVAGAGAAVRCLPQARDADGVPVHLPGHGCWRVSCCCDGGAAGGQGRGKPAHDLARPVSLFVCLCAGGGVEWIEACGYRWWCC